MIDRAVKLFLLRVFNHASCWLQFGIGIFRFKSRVSVFLSHPALSQEGERVLGVGWTNPNRIGSNVGEYLEVGEMEGGILPHSNNSNFPWPASAAHYFVVVVVFFYRTRITRLSACCRRGFVPDGDHQHETQLVFFKDHWKAWTCWDRVAGRPSLQKSSRSRKVSFIRF